MIREPGCGLVRSTGGRRSRWTPLLSTLLCAGVCLVPPSASAALGADQPGANNDAPSKLQWRSATAAELDAALPARAQIVKEHIETEMHSASGIIDARGRVVAAVVLITAGYAASGKYYYYLLAQAPIRLGNSLALPPGSYAVGWNRASNGLLVHIYDAETGAARGDLLARPLIPRAPIISVKIWPPSGRSVLQIGRFAVPYFVGN